jgi:hypothetical protein
MISRYLCWFAPLSVGQRIICRGTVVIELRKSITISAGTIHNDFIRVPILPNYITRRTEAALENENVIYVRTVPSIQNPHCCSFVSVLQSTGRGTNLFYWNAEIAACPYDGQRAWIIFKIRTFSGGIQLNYRLGMSINAGYVYIWGQELLPGWFFKIKKRSLL